MVGSGQGAPRQEGSLSGCAGPGRPVEEARSVGTALPSSGPRGWQAQAGTQCSLGWGALEVGRQGDTARGPRVQRPVPQDLERQHAHIGIMVEFSTALMSKLDGINRHSFNSFRLRVGEAPGRRAGPRLRVGLCSPASWQPHSQLGVCCHLLGKTLEIPL